MFLNVYPYGVSKWWQLCLYNSYSQGNYEPLHKLMTKYMWRTAKKHVLKELGLPENTEEV